VPDYILGTGTAALYISLRYHLQKPDYLFQRIRELRNRRAAARWHPPLFPSRCLTHSFRLRVVLCSVDVEEVPKPLGEVNKVCALNGCSLVCAWSHEEAARYLETFKLYERKSAESIQERTESDYLSRLTGALTCIRGVNRTDVQSLGREFGSLAALLQATPQQLAACPGIGPTKVRRLQETFRDPLRRAAAPRQTSMPAFAEGGAAAAGAAGAAAAGPAGAGREGSPEERAAGPEAGAASPGEAVAGAAEADEEAEEEEEEEEEEERGGAEDAQPLYTLADAEADEDEMRSVLD